MSTPVQTRPAIRPAKKQNGAGFLVVAVLLLIGAIALIVTQGDTAGTPGQAPGAFQIVKQQPQVPTVAPARPTTRVVIYSISGTAKSVSITMGSPTGTVQLTEAPTLHGYTFKPGSPVYISAQNEGETGTVTCSITVDGKEISNNTASGAYNIATCDGLA